MRKRAAKPSPPEAPTPEPQAIVLEHELARSHAPRSTRRTAPAVRSALVLVATALFLSGCGGGEPTAPAKPATPKSAAPAKPGAPTSKPFSPAPQRTPAQKVDAAYTKALKLDHQAMAAVTALVGAIEDPEVAAEVAACIETHDGDATACGDSSSALNESLRGTGIAYGHGEGLAQVEFLDTQSGASMVSATSKTGSSFLEDDAGTKTCSGKTPGCSRGFWAE